MCDYPEDIGFHDGDYRSPFYDSSFDDAVEEKKDQLYSLLREDLIENKGININEILYSQINCVFDFTEWVIELMSEVSDEINTIIDLVIYGVKDEIAITGLLSRLVNAVNSELIASFHSEELD